VREAKPQYPSLPVPIDLAPRFAAISVTYKKPSLIPNPGRATFQSGGNRIMPAINTKTRYNPLQAKYLTRNRLRSSFFAQEAVAATRRTHIPRPVYPCV
jgi:hypothetical protein